MSLSARRAWIEIRLAGMSEVLIVSLSARRAWIEIFVGWDRELILIVALRKESVDRNSTVQIVIVVMDAVALRKESVDRNEKSGTQADPAKSSLSARRAWIEICPPIGLCRERVGRSPQGERG